MKKLKLLFFVLFFITYSTTVSEAHYMWIETAATGKPGKAQAVNVYFGEYTYGVVEKTAGDAFQAVKEFTLWAVAPSGKKTQLSTTRTPTHYTASFTPTEKGTYTLFMNNDNIDVIDYTQYDFGIFKTHYHATARVVVGKEIKPSSTTNDAGLSIQYVHAALPEQQKETKLRITYKGQPLAEAELDLYQADLWSKKLETDAEGYVSFTLPWEGKYILEVTRKEEVPGTYKGQDYEFVWHCATYSITL